MKSIRNCLNKQLVDLCQQSMQLEELSNKVSQLLPANLAQNCLVGSFNKGRLILTTYDAVWASQIRYAIPDLRDKLRKEAGMYQLMSIEVKVAEPIAGLPLKTPQAKHSLSDKAKATIISESQACAYQPLKKALIHLADGIL